MDFIEGRSRRLGFHFGQGNRDLTREKEAGLVRR
jgi:hypothetical protein